MFMDEEKRSLELVRLLYGDEGGEGQAMGERMRRWGEAFETWLEERKTRFSPNVGKEAYNAWEDFLGFTQKPPWEVRVEDIEVYVEALKKRGLSIGTIHKRLTGLAKFYKHCQERGIEAECGGVFNPVAGASRPRLTQYEKANYLSEEEEAALREAIQVYLEASGRRAEIKPGDYVFAPGKEPLVREAGGRAEDWAGERPLSKDELHYLLKLYAGWAGLKAKEITCHTLRHTAAMWQAERGEGGGAG